MTTTPPPFPPWWESMRRGGVAPQDLRVSDAERQAMSEILSRHYAEGRLDDIEFQERLGRAMSAKTRADLSSLTYDLPGLSNGAAGAPLPLLPRRRWYKVAIVVVAIWLAVLTFAPFFVWMPAPHVPWLLVGVVLFLVLRRGRWHRHHHHLHGGPYRRDLPRRLYGLS